MKKKLKSQNDQWEPTSESEDPIVILNKIKKHLKEPIVPAKKQLVKTPHGFIEF